MNPIGAAGKRAVFLDRDGTLNVDKGFVHKREDFQFCDGAVEALTRLKRMGFLLVVVTNQSGVGRGLYTEKEVERLHRWINGELRKHGTKIDRFYFCPHHPDSPLVKYRVRCACRKPEPGMLLRAMKELGIDPRASYLIGDAARDIAAGKKAGVRTILVTSGGDPREKRAGVIEPDAVVSNLLEAVRHIEKHAPD